MKHIAITGYNSFIGNFFYKKYKEKIKISKFKNNINKSAQLKKFIYEKKITHLINFAGLSRVKCDEKKNQCLKSNYRAIKGIINNLNKLKNKPFFIFVSTCHVYKYSKNKLKENGKTDPRSLYAKLKLKSENYVKKNYKNYAIIRLFNVYGPHQPNNFFIPDIKYKILNNKTIEIDKSVRDFIHVDEVSRIIKFILNKNIKNIINVGTGKGIQLIKIVKYLSRKYRLKPNLKIQNKQTKLIANISLLKSNGFKPKKNEKYINF